jgi:hypothetical protein
LEGVSIARTTVVPVPRSREIARHIEEDFLMNRLGHSIAMGAALLVAAGSAQAQIRQGTGVGTNSPIGTVGGTVYPTQNVPPGQMPPAGMCRVWIDGVPAGRQPAPTDCSTAQRNVPRNARVIYGGRAQPSYPNRNYPSGTVRDGRYDPRLDPRSSQYDPRLDPRSSQYDPRFDPSNRRYDPRYDPNRNGTYSGRNERDAARLERERQQRQIELAQQQRDRQLKEQRKADKEREKQWKKENKGNKGHGNGNDHNDDGNHGH